MYDELTKNESFLKMRDFLYGKQIQNYNFMLEVKDKSLATTDTTNAAKTIMKIYMRYLDNKMTRDDDEYIGRVKNEMSNNIWFFFRELLRIPVRSSIFDAHFQLLPHLMESIYLYSKNISFILESPRQTGRTLLFRSLALREMLLHNDVDILFGEHCIDSCRNERCLMRELIRANNWWIQLLYPAFYNSFKCRIDANFVTNDLNTDAFTKNSVDISPNTNIFVSDYEFSKIEWMSGIKVIQPQIFCAESCYNKLGNDRLEDPSLFYIDHILPQLTAHNLQIYDYDDATLQLFFPSVLNIAHIIYRPEDIPGLEENTERLTAILQSEEALRREWFLK